MAWWGSAILIAPFEKVQKVMDFIQIFLRCRFRSAKHHNIIANMPKNWSDHEAEIRRLYIDDGRTLKDVRDIMSAKFDFNASEVVPFDTRRESSLMLVQDSCLSDEI